MKISSGKLGAPKGHPKYFRKDPTPTRRIEYTEDICPHCAAKLKSPTSMRRILEEEIPKPQPLEVTEHLVNTYICPNCNKKITAKNSAPKGRFGKNVQTHIALSKFEDRLPLRKVKNSLLRNHNLEITNPGIYGITKQVAQKLEEPYYDIMKWIRSCKILYIDETSYKLNGETWWLWVFSCEDAILFVIRKSRGERVIEEILGKEYNGIIVSDGWIVYSKFAKTLQRCWAHLLRECDELEDNHNNFKSLNEKIHGLFNEIYDIRESPPSDEKRLELQDKMKERLRIVGEKMTFDSRFKKLGTKILNGIENWFTCVFYTNVEPTNNYAEQSLRELIIQRKIMGGLRSVDGAIVMERITTMLASWKKQGKPLFETMRNCL
ncbi:IS66 family transposase [Candidatus Pacearchaeota archaeon]|nr:IS66 family transposase [Candidatus Pacearchaeota archaeon]